MKKENTSLVIGYWQYAPLEDLHQRSQLWLSEMAFWKEEMRFMEKLVNNHFAYFIDAQRAKTTIKLTDEIQILEGQLAVMEENVLEHQQQLKHLLEQQGKKQEKEFRTAHGTLEQMLDDFLIRYKSVKKMLFKEADDVLKEEKMQRFISLSG